MNSLLLASINWSTFGIVMAILALLAIVFSILIVTVSKLCAVKEDQKANQINELLAGANCGGCGYAGCADYAKALSEGRADINKCNATCNESKVEIAKILGVEFGGSTPTFAVVKCNGGINAVDKFNYVGNGSCISIKSVQGGNKLCLDGCLGGGTCVASCGHGGVSIKDGVAVVNRSLCGGCGSCVINCPKNLIELIPTTAKVYVACNNKCKGKTAMESCKVSCIGCGMCAKVCPNGAITMVDNLAVIDYSKCNGCKTCIAKCVRKCIKEI